MEVLFVKVSLPPWINFLMVVLKSVEIIYCGMGASDTIFSGIIVNKFFSKISILIIVLSFNISEELRDKF